MSKEKLENLESELANAINSVFEVADLPDNLSSFSTILDKLDVFVDIDANNKYFVYNITMRKL
jgi:hypothetical protein